ncbi:MAG TPA: GIY-YIG nuclease family protein [Patescibacteria group bacterium]|nr:GIY-YIG nuclease family protein [Patescibacteria group bacterium]
MARSHNYYVYIISSINGVIYIGVTNDLIRRVDEHRMELAEGFTKKYQCKKLVYYEHYPDINIAIKREKEMKGWRREKKLALIEQSNPHWHDLYQNLIT